MTQADELRSSLVEEEFEDVMIDEEEDRGACE